MKRAGYGSDVVDSENESKFCRALRSGEKLESGIAKLTVHAQWIMCVVSDLSVSKAGLSSPRVRDVRSVDNGWSFDEKM